MKPDHELEVQCFYGYDNLVTAVRVVELAKELGLTIKEKVSGTYWVAFIENGELLSNISFYHPSHAYAFLLGVKAARAK